MEREEYDRIYRLETTHFWYRGLHALVLSTIARHASARREPGRPLRILDAGCGTGGLMLELRSIGEVTGLDFSSHAIACCAARRERRLVQGSVSALPFGDAAFDVVVSTDVLYHRAVADDRAALRELARACRPGGLVLLHLAAHAWLMSHHDRTVHTARRYSRREVLELARAAPDLEIVRVTYTNAWLFPVAVLARRFGATRDETRSDLRPIPGVVNAALTLVQRLEGFVALRVGLPVGLSHFLVLRKTT